MGTRYTPSKRLLQQKSWHLSRRAGGKSLIWKAFAVITHEIRTAILEVNGVRFPLSPISSVKKHDVEAQPSVAHRGACRSRPKVLRVHERGASNSVDTLQSD